MAPNCKGLCHTFDGYTTQRKSLYINNMIYCPICSCGYKKQGRNNCNCCGGKIRNRRISNQKNSRPNDNIILIEA